MTTDTHQTAPTRYVEANGIRFAFRRFGKEGGAPLVFNMRFMGTMQQLAGMSAFDARVCDQPRSSKAP